MAFDNELTRRDPFINALARGYDPNLPENNPIQDVQGTPNLLSNPFFSGRIQVIGTPNLDAVRAINAAYRAGVRADREMCNAGGGLVGGGGSQCYFGAEAFNKASEIVSNPNAPDAIRSKAQGWLNANPDVDASTTSEPPAPTPDPDKDKDEDEEEDDGIDWEGILDQAVTVLNGVRGIFGPGGIFIPLPSIEDIKDILGGGGSGSTTTTGGTPSTTGGGTPPPPPPPEPVAGTPCTINGEDGTYDENGVCVRIPPVVVTTSTEGNACTTEDGKDGTIQGGVCVPKVITTTNDDTSGDTSDDSGTVTTGPPDRDTMTPSFCETGWEYPDGTCVPWEDIPGATPPPTPIPDGTVCQTTSGEDGTFQGGRCVPNVTNTGGNNTGPQDGESCQTQAGEDGIITGGVCVAIDPDRTTQIPSFCPSGYQYPDGTCVPPEDVNNGSTVSSEGNACITEEGAEGTITGGVCIPNVTTPDVDTNEGGNGGPVNGEACYTDDGSEGTITDGVCIPNITTVGGGNDDDDDPQAGDPCFNEVGQGGVIVILPDGTSYCAVSSVTGGGGDINDQECDCGGGVKGVVNAAGGCDCPSIITTTDDDGTDDDPPDPLIGLGLFAGSRIAGKNASVTKNGPLFRVLKSRGYQPKKSERRPIAGWLSDIAKEFRS